MPSPDELRTLIERIETADGPLRMMTSITIETTNGRGMWAMSDALDDSLTMDAIAGVLRRDMHARGLVFTTHTGPRATSIEWGTPKPSLTSRALAQDALTAHLRAWLSAHAAGLVGRQEATDG